MPAPGARSEAQARSLLDEELDRLAPRREALGECGAHAVAGWTLEHALEWEAAALAWQRASDLDAIDAPAVFHLGLCLLELGRFADAAAEFRRAAEIDSASNRLDWFDEDPAYRLGNALHAQGEFDAALAAYEESAARNVLGVDSLREVARLHIVRGEREAALRALTRMETRAVRLTVRAEVQALRAEAQALRRRE